MKKTILLLLILCSYICNSQITDKDTLYILFNGKKMQIKENPAQLPIPKIIEPITSYKFLFNAEGTSYLQFVRSKYLNIDAIKEKKLSDIKHIRRCFLRKNRNKIINNDFFEEKGIEESYWYLYKFKTIYIIDKTEAKKGNIPVYEIGVYSTYFPQS